MCNKEENTKEIVEECSKITQVHVSNIRTLDDVYELILQYGVLFSCEKRAANIVSKIQKECLEFKNEIQKISHKKVAYCIWRKPWMVAANDTFINHLLELNNFSNAFIEQTRYPEVDVETLTSEKEIDLILLSSEPYPFKNEHIKELQEKNNNTEIKLVDGEYFSWFGSRLVGAFKYFKSLH